MKKGKPPREKDKGDSVWAGSQPQWQGLGLQQPGRAPFFPLGRNCIELLPLRPYRRPFLKEQVEGKLPGVGSIWETFQAEELEKDNNFLTETIQSLQQIVLFTPNAQININSQSSEFSTPSLTQAVMKSVKQWMIPAVGQMWVPIPLSILIGSMHLDRWRSHPQLKFPCL